MSKDVVRLEAARLFAQLGRITEGGMIEGVEAIGATSVPELTVTSPVDIGVAVWPVPLTKEHEDKVITLGYVPVQDTENASEARFFHADKNVQLFIVAAGSSAWTNYLLSRDFLRGNEQARQRFATWKAQADGSRLTKAAFFAALLKEAEKWWTVFYGFAPLERITRELAAFGRPWFISSGWALDLFVERVSRVHHDVDVVMPRTAAYNLKAYLLARDWKLVLPLDGLLEPWPLGSSKEPQIQVHAYREGAFIDFLLSDITAQTWTYRRDPRITYPAEKAFLQSPTGVPFLAPEMVLLFKSKNTGTEARDQDQRDFETVYPHLDAARKRWLRQALSITDPEHRWLGQLS